MATLPAYVSTLELSRLFRRARCYAPDHVTAMLSGLLDARNLALLVDVDALERTTFARVDRVLQLVCTALARLDVSMYLAGPRERERALALQRALPRCTYIVRSAAMAIPFVRATLASHTPLIALSDSVTLFDLLTERDRGLAIGRPELARGNVTAVADTSVRATLWWLYEARARALSS